jgi:bacterioferritin (cytochrome b1)
MSELEQATQVAAGVWQHRHRVELQAAVRFDRLAKELAQLGANHAVVSLAKSAADDERRHASLCRELIAHFGGEPPDEIAPAAPPVGISGMSPRQRVLYELIAMSCITETLSTALLGKLVEKAEDPLVRKNMHSILRDEIKHSQLGWAHLAAEHEAGQPIDIGAHLPAMLSSTVNEEIFSDAPDHAHQDKLSGMGSLSRIDRLNTFIEVLTAVIFPGLQKFGIDTGAAKDWLKTQTHKG